MDAASGDVEEPIWRMMVMVMVMVMDEIADEEEGSIKGVGS